MFHREFMLNRDLTWEHGGNFKTKSWRKISLREYQGPYIEEGTAGHDEGRSTPFLTPGRDKEGRVGDTCPVA